MTPRLDDIMRFPISDDGLASCLAHARFELDEAKARLRLLVAFGREFQGQRPFPLAWLAEAAGMSVSGVRTVYGPEDVERVARLLDVPVPARPRRLKT